MERLARLATEWGSPALLLLAVLLAIDALFIATSLWLLHVGSLAQHPNFNIDAEGSFAESYGSLKWLACLLLCLWQYFRAGRDLLYLGWALVFAYILVDDATGIHEWLGFEIARAMGWGDAFRLHGADFGELIVFFTAGTIILAVIGFAYWMSEDQAAKAFSRRLFLGMCALALFAVAIDALHSALRTIPKAMSYAGAVEDSGEMMVASVLVYLVVAHIANRSDSAT